MVTCTICSSFPHLIRHGECLRKNPRRAPFIIDPSLGIRPHQSEITMRAVWDVRSSISRSKIRGNGMNLAL